MKPYIYFKDLTRDTVLSGAALNAQQLLIKKGDILNILVSSLNRQEDDIFNAKAAQGGYEVNDEGEIYLQRLGKIRVEGLTRRKLKQQLEKDLKVFLKDPLVSISFTNHKVTVIGRVSSPQVLPMPEERISLLDAIAKTGNPTQEAQLSKILVIRDSGAVQKVVKTINLEDRSLFSSPYYYLQPNDVVVVNADEKLAFSEQKRMRYQQFSAIVFQTLTMAILIYQTFFR